jgi:hypothetical protein
LPLKRIAARSRSGLWPVAIRSRVCWIACGAEREQAMPYEPYAFYTWNGFPARIFVKDGLPMYCEVWDPKTRTFVKDEKRVFMEQVLLDGREYEVSEDEFNAAVEKRMRDDAVPPVHVHLQSDGK